MGKSRVNVLTIAGFDPSGGAGIAADLKVFEQYKVYGFAACTAITYQNQSTFEAVDWVENTQLLKQMDLQFQQHRIDYVKIGLIKGFEQLESILSYLREKKVKIVLDPILSASAGYDFHSATAGNFENHLKDLFLITPNWKEAQLMTGEENPIDQLMKWSHECAIYLKGGHRTDKVGQDVLLYEGKEFHFNPKVTIKGEKHGSGCVLSSALLAGLAKGFPLQKACLKAKDYTARFLRSNSGLLGYHK